MAPTHSVSVAAAVLDETGRLLVVQRRDIGTWELPGGVLELNETIHDGLRREVREETGLHVQPDRLTGIYKHMTRHIVALVFRCHVTSGQLKPTPEAQQHRWLPPAEVPDLLPEVLAVRLLDALPGTTQRGPAVRSHDGIRLLDRPTASTS